MILAAQVEDVLISCIQSGDVPKYYRDHMTAVALAASEHE